MLKSSLLKAGLVMGTGLLLAGCAAPIIGGLTVSQVMTAATVGSYLAAGKGTGELALSLVTGKDCRVLEGALRKDRAICEEPHSPATAGDFKGLSTIVTAMEPDDGSEGRPVLLAGVAGDEVTPEFTDFDYGSADTTSPVQMQDGTSSASLVVVSQTTIRGQSVASRSLQGEGDVLSNVAKTDARYPTVSTGSLMTLSAVNAQLPAARAVKNKNNKNKGYGIRMAWKPAMRPFAYQVLPRPTQAPRSAIFARGKVFMPKPRPVAG